jgi:plasmid stabilization system protein ParE
VKFITKWWRKNRPAAPFVFEDELEEAVEKLRIEPHLGTEYGVLSGETIRFMLLPKSAQHVYYAVDDDNGVVVIYTVWGARRGRGPRL